METWTHTFCFGQSETLYWVTLKESEMYVFATRYLQKGHKMVKRLKKGKHAYTIPGLVKNY